MAGLPEGYDPEQDPMFGGIIRGANSYYQSQRNVEQELRDLGVLGQYEFLQDEPESARDDDEPEPGW
jgi:hypothetical protein